MLVLDAREPASKAIVRSSSTFVHAKLVYKPADEVGVVIPGRDVPVVPLAAVSLDALRTVSSLAPSPPSSSSCLSRAVSLAVDLLETSKKKAGKRKVIVVSNFEEIPAREREFLGRVFDRLSAGPVHVKIVHFDCRGAPNGAPRPHWLENLVEYRGEFVDRKVYRTLSQLMTCFPIKDTKEAHVVYSGTLKLADKVEVAVKLVPKTKKEPFMSLGNDSGEHHPASPTTNVADCYRPDDIEQLHPVPTQDRIKGYRFGNVIVPMSQPLAELSKLSPERGMWLLGFIDRGEISPDLFMGAAKVLFADKKDPGSVAALSSLAAAMVKKQKVAVMHVVLRAGSALKLMVAHPVARNPAYFILKEAPFLEDVSAINCAPLPEPEADLVLGARDFVRANMLDETTPELERIGNPTLHRAVNYLTEQFLKQEDRAQEGHDGFTAVPSDGELFVECFGKAILEIDS